MQFVKLSQNSITSNQYEIIFLDMCLDDRGYQHISWIETRNGIYYLMYKFWNGIQWETQANGTTVHKTNNEIEYSSIIINNGEVKLAFCEKSETGSLINIISVNTSIVNQYSLNSVSWISLLYHDSQVYLITYELTDFKIYKETITGLVLQGSKTAEVNDYENIKVTSALNNIVILFLKTSLYFNFFNTFSDTWSQTNFTKITSSSNNILDFDICGLTTLEQCGISWIRNSNGTFVYQLNLESNGTENYTSPSGIIYSSSTILTAPSGYTIGGYNLVSLTLQDDTHPYVILGGSQSAVLYYDSSWIFYNTSISSKQFDIISKFDTNIKLLAKNRNSIYAFENNSNDIEAQTPSLSILNKKKFALSTWSSGSLNASFLSGDNYDNEIGEILKESKRPILFAASNEHPFYASSSESSSSTSYSSSSESSFSLSSNSSQSESSLSQSNSSSSQSRSSSSNPNSSSSESNSSSSESNSSSSESNSSSSESNSSSSESNSSSSESNSSSSESNSSSSESNSSSSESNSSSSESNSSSSQSNSSSSESNSSSSESNSSSSQSNSSSSESNSSSSESNSSSSQSNSSSSTSNSSSSSEQYSESSSSESNSSSSESNSSSSSEQYSESSSSTSNSSSSSERYSESSSTSSNSSSSESNSSSSSKDSSSSSSSSSKDSSSSSSYNVTLTFEFKTYVVPDRLLVTQGGTVLLDTGFIATGDNFDTFIVNHVEGPFDFCVDAPTAGTIWELTISGGGYNLSTNGEQGYFCWNYDTILKLNPTPNQINFGQGVSVYEDVLAVQTPTGVRMYRNTVDNEWIDSTTLSGGAQNIGQTSLKQNYIVTSTGSGVWITERTDTDEWGSPELLTSEIITSAPNYRQMATDGDFIVIGYPFDSTLGTSTGKVVIFNRVTSSSTTIYNPDPLNYTFFGWSVGISGNYIVISWYRRKIVCYHRTGVNSWGSSTDIYTSNDAIYSLCIFGDYIAIPYGHSTSYKDIMVFHRTGTNTWDSGTLLEGIQTSFGGGIVYLTMYDNKLVGGGGVFCNQYTKRQYYVLFVRTGETWSTYKAFMPDMSECLGNGGQAYCSLFEETLAVGYPALTASGPYGTVYVVDTSTFF